MSASLQKKVDEAIGTRRADILSLGGKSIVSGTLATCLMGAIVGVLD